MNYAIDRITLDVHSSMLQGTLRWKKDDTARRIEASFVENGKPWVLLPDCAASIYMEKPDGTVIWSDVQRGETGSIVYYDLKGDETVVPGVLNCEFRVYDGDELLTSPCFKVAVDETVYDEDAIYSENRETFLTESVNRMLRATAETEAVADALMAAKENGDFNGSPGKDGKSAYESALDGGYDGTEEEFNEDLANVGNSGGGADLSDAVPLMNGTASAGVAETAARADHVHPADTTRMPAISEMGILMTPTDSDRFPVYDYEEAVMKYTPWARILSLLLSEIDKVPEADLATVAKGLLAPGTIDVYATLPERMTEDGVIALVSDIAAALKNYYTAEEVDGLVSAIPKFSIEVVTKLPSENISSTTVYLVVSEGDEENLYAEYIRVNGKWEKLGEQKVDLTGYATEEFVEDYAQPKGEYLPADQLAPAVNDALAQAKASGEFDGKDGADGSRWFSGTQVSIDGGFPVNLVTGAKTGDYYLNTFTGNVYKAGSSVWAYEGNIKGADGVGISGASINANGQLVVNYTDGTSATLGKVVGADGYTPVKGVDYFDGEPGYTPVKGVDYFDGKDGVSPTVATSKSGKVTTVTITDKNGQKTATINDGVDGSSVTVSSVSESSADGGTNVVTFSDGKKLNVKNGSKGSPGAKGDKGDPYTLTNADKAEIAEEVKVSLDGVPDYWESELATKAEAIQIAMETAGRNKSAFLWYTDAHWQNNSKRSPALLNYLLHNTPMNKVNFGGDIVGDPSPYSHNNVEYVYEWRKMIANLPNHHSVYGNHDVNHWSTDVKGTAYALLLASEESAEMVVGGDSYYYIDNPSEKTRYLYLCYPNTVVADLLAQTTFITETLLSTPEGWHIVAISHRWWQYSNSSNPTSGGLGAFETDVLSVFDAYNARENRNGSNYFYAADFTDAKGKVEFCIGGHIHVDYDFESEGGIPVIITASDTNQDRSPDETEDSGTLGTVTESAVYGIIADYTNPDSTKITVVGIGRGTSRIVSKEPVKPTAKLLNLDRTYVSGTAGVNVGEVFDESKAYLNVYYGDGSFNAGSCTASNITENSVTVKESGVGGICVAYPVDVSIVDTNSVRLTFDYSGAGKCRTYYSLIDPSTGKTFSTMSAFVNDTAGASGSADVTLDLQGCTKLVICFSSNTGNTKTFENVSLTEA